MEEYCVYCTDWEFGKCIHRKEAVGPPNCFYLNTIKLVEDFIIVQKKTKYVFEKIKYQNKIEGEEKKPN